MGIITFLLLPFSWLYGSLMMMRNFLFDTGLFPSRRFDIPVISVGNLSLGGTGKTPHTEYLIRLLRDRYYVSTLSRGYGRETRGFILASRRTNARYIGDEPLQYLKKFGNIRVAVDENRARGIRKLLEKIPGPDVILLDDAFQHRWVKPGLSVLLTDYLNPYFEDRVVPSGRLREFPIGARRADLIIVTKTPKILSPITRRRLLEKVNPLPRQQVFFSYIQYGDPLPVFDFTDPCFATRPAYILLFTGIAQDYPLKEHLERLCRDLIVVRYPDHHHYTLKDFESLKKQFEDLPGHKKILVTTEKDAMRLKTPEAATVFRNLPLFFVPIEIRFHGNDQPAFDQIILDYMEKHRRPHPVPPPADHPEEDIPEE
ncbi:MAG TPA: tetraacyldisaccharide 4'-kinase [Bacteroidales bacterium]|nr:tetraacyldisaccharide 4'-kinase [Bacteroidales bacterium]